MYYKTGDYPELEGLNKKQKNEFVSEAVKLHNKWISLRFYFVIALTFACSFLVAEFEVALSLPDWSAWVIFPIFGLCFYIYLLWEINGAVFQAVYQHTNQPNKKINKDT
ncbi:hypothetical protein H4J58_00145 [Colwellia sp. MB3u-70]|uniref:hypothetical protein n=1 Tax=unclassified Colwellia TaxID=196834 RepID=UPI0015F556F5|nr:MULTISPECIES: hypothetical protein [unclassified Colwellia]MBA6291526.1 hypothetical protein [Colwellia sp. MB3u-8]MBA6305558.1 hypothetical protein [Colwellia sp. MB3u-70]